MQNNEGAHVLPSSLSAVFDSSDDDDLLNTQATQSAVDNDHSANGCTAQDRQDDLLRSQILRLSDEYRQAGEQLQEQLSCLGLSTTQLSPAAASDLQCVAAAAQALRLQGCQNSAFLLVLSQLRIQESQLACAQHESQELATWLAHKQNSAVQQLKKLRSVLDSAQSSGIAASDQTNGYQHNIAMLAQKEQQYTHQLQVLEEKLASVQYSPLLRHTALMQRQMQYDQQAKEVAAKEARLAQFLDLPPDMTAAKSVYEQKLQSLMSARKQLEDGLAGL